MEVQIDKGIIPVHLFIAPKQLFQGVHLGEHVLVGTGELPVEVLPRQTCPVVPYHHSVRVEHGNYLEYQTLPQESGAFPAKVLQQSFHHPGPVGLAGVTPTGYEHHSEVCP